VHALSPSPREGLGEATQHALQATTGDDGLLVAVGEARVLVFTAAYPDERSERAWLEFQRVVNMMEVPRKLGVELELKEVLLDDMATAILEVRRVLDALRGRR
jgi:hypothetical protein